MLRKVKICLCSLSLLSFFSLSSKNVNINKVNADTDFGEYSYEVVSNDYAASVIANDTVTYVMVDDTASNEYKYYLYEYDGLSVYNGKDTYLGFVVQQRSDVDITLKISTTEIYSHSLTLSEGYYVETKFAAKIFSVGGTAGVKFDYSHSNSQKTTDTIDKTYNLYVNRAQEGEKCGTWYLYERGYTTDYLVVVKDKKNNKIVEARRVKNADGVLVKNGLLQKTPTLLTPLAYKC